MRKRTRSVAAGACVALLLTASAAPADKPPELLKRVGNWVANYDEDACHLYAQFGEGDATMALRITKAAPGDWFQLAIYGARMKSDYPRNRIWLDFGLGSKPVEEESFSATAGKFSLAIVPSTRLDTWQYRPGREAAPTITPAQEAAVTGLTVAFQGRKPFRLEFGSLAKPLAAMRRCLDDLIRHWGYDPVAEAALQRHATALNNPYEWLNSNDYPRAALMNGHNGLVKFRLDVDADGKVAGCHVIARTEPDDFADITCQNVTKRAKLEPALDAQGKPVRSYLVQQVRWQAP